VGGFKMTLAIKQHTENGYYVLMEWDKTNVYHVEVCPCLNDNMCGYPINEMYYTMEEKKKAEATFRRYVKKYCKGE
jgi:hypothetical protein